MTLLLKSARRTAVASAGRRKPVNRFVPAGVPATNAAALGRGLPSESGLPCATVCHGGHTRADTSASASTLIGQTPAPRESCRKPAAIPLRVVLMGVPPTAGTAPARAFRRWSAVRGNRGSVVAAEILERVLPFPIRVVGRRVQDPDAGFAGACGGR